jgi:hypothetical protein
MAKPAFIYAFDNLGPERFTELCSLLLASRHKGFLRGGVGADGGVDAELDNTFGMWHSESRDALLNEIIQPGQTVVFQFKHVVTGRAGGQSKARDHLQSMYNCRRGYVCEIHRELVVGKKPDCYVLVTNVEVNSNFRAKFTKQCRLHNPDIGHYQVIGLDELETWITSAVELRHLYFPTIFGPPQYNLRVQISEGVGIPLPFKSHFDNAIPIFLVRVMNVGVVPSYISTISFKSIVDGEEKNLFILNLENELLKQMNPEPGAVVEPGRNLDYRFTFDILHGLKTLGKEVFPFEVRVYDEIGNIYSTKIPEDLSKKILE